MSEFSVDPLAPDSEPAQHYDTVVEAWGQLLEEDLHYGYFAAGDEMLVAATDALTDQMLGAAALEAGNHVLDVGCGTGKAACRMAAEHGARVTGISPSTVCVEQAQAQADSLELGEYARFCPGDGTAMAFADASFDRVWIMESSHLMDDKPALLSEAARVLRPGGRVVLCDIILQGKLPLEQVIAYRDEFLLLRDVFGRAKMEPLSFYANQWQELGLEIIEQVDISAQTYPTFDRWRANAQGNRKQVIELIGEPAWQKFLASCAVLERFWQEQVLGYGIVCARKPG